MAPQRRTSLTGAHAALPAALSLSQTRRERGSERAVPCRSETGAAARCGGLRGERLGLGGQAAAAGAAQPGHGAKGRPRRTRGREQLSPGKARLQKQAPAASAQAPSLRVCIACAETAEVWWGTAGRGLSLCRDSDRLSLAAGLGEGGGLQAFAPCS